MSPTGQHSLSQIFPGEHSQKQFSHGPNGASPLTTLQVLFGWQIPSGWYVVPELVAVLVIVPVVVVMVVGMVVMVVVAFVVTLVVGFVGLVVGLVRGVVDP